MKLFFPSGNIYFPDSFNVYSICVCRLPILLL